MLERIYVKQFAIIDELVLDFQPPFTVITGETGAGKSIIIDAVAVLLGGRIQTEMVRYGTEKAYIEGVFSLRPDNEAWEMLLENGYAETKDDPLILSREINIAGKNVCRINGRTVTLSVYRQVALGLIDIHGQHDYQHLMQTQHQIGMLDAYGGARIMELRNEIKEIYQKVKNLEKEIDKAEKGEQERLARLDFLEFQLNEIDNAKITPGEMEELAAEINKLSHSERIMKNLQGAYQCLYGYGDQPSAYSMISEALNLLRDLARFDEKLENLYAGLEPTVYIIDETVREISDYQDNLEISPHRLEEAENRMYLLKRLCQKYGETLTDVLNYRESVIQEIEKLNHWQDQAQNWKQELAILEEKYDKLAAELHELRVKTAKSLEASIDKELKDLEMGKAHFKVNIELQEPGANGKDHVEFLISANAGEPYLPLAKIASGGELSRITLAMKRILANVDLSDTLVFDEIESGIGGKTIHAVADKLLAISQSQQVICVTHAAAIASRANQHVLLEKLEEAGRTKTSARVLKEQERVEELARMLGGDRNSPELLRHAAGLLNLQN